MRIRHAPEEMIREVKREIALRRSLYPKWVSQGRMKREMADWQISVFEDVLEIIENHGGYSYATVS